MSRLKRGNRRRERTEEARAINADRKWFVVQCKPACDMRAFKDLQDAGVDVWMPVYRVIETRRGRKVDGERRFFASYLFAGLTPTHRGETNFRAILDSEAVLGILGAEGPVEIGATLLQLLADRLAGQDKDETERGRRRQEAALFELGSFHRIIGGPFSSFMAEVTGVLETGRIRADVDIFGRRTPVEFDPSDLRAA